MDLIKYVDSRIRYFADKQADIEKKKAEQLSKTAKQKLEKVKKAVSKIKNPKKKKKVVLGIIDKLKRIGNSPLIKFYIGTFLTALSVAGADYLVRGISSAFSRRMFHPANPQERTFAVATGVRTEEDYRRAREENDQYAREVEERRRQREEENRRNINNQEDNRAEREAVNLTESAARDLRQAESHDEAARTLSVISEMNAPEAKKPWKTVLPSWASGAGFKAPNLSSAGKNVKLTHNPSRETFGQNLLNKIQNHASVAEIKNMKGFSQSTGKKVSFGEELLNKIKNHATSKIVKVKGKEGKFGSQFFSGGYGGNALNRTLPGVNSYRGQANPRFGSLDMDSGYLVRNYDSMPWAYQDAMRRESKKRTKSNKYFDI